METNTATRQSDALNWTLKGIRAERVQLQERLEYLASEERRLTGNGLTGKATQATTTKTASKKLPPRKRKLSAETRQKMREAAQKRWHKKEATTTSAAAQAEQTAVPPIPDSISQ